VLAIGLVVMALGAGCGSGSTQATGPGGSPPTAAPSLAGSPDPLQPPSHIVAPVTVHSLSTTSTPPAVASGHKRVSAPWTYLGTRNGGKSIVIQFHAGGCQSFSGVQVVPTASAVQVTVWESQPTHPRVCPQFVQVLNGSITLARPIGSRTLLHAPLSRI
jgi:hypothetical protein